MKALPVFPLIAALALPLSFAEEVPPAFENGGDTESQAEQGYDPFDPVFEAPRLARVQVEFVELAHKDLTRLMMKEKPETADATALRKIVQDMVDKDAAKVIDTQMVTGRSGNKFTTHSREEFNYPTEFTPASMDEKTKKQMEELLASPFPVNPAFPTAFETRNLGSKLEAEPTVGEDYKYIDLRIVSELLWHTGNTVWHEGKDAAGNVFRMSMPEFFMLELSTSFSCVSGQYTLAGVLSPKNALGKADPDRKVMVFVKCDALPVVP
ncbi:MAG TPA: hypothetical protein VLO11_10025 [Luteolibacter sp.]|nr:hypothetical protein [Luteolibacter sp.]